ncbi:MAG: hypothetical protein Kow0029_00750 [Candidatus Rifleibacteriota bacterium]
MRKILNMMICVSVFFFSFSVYARIDPSNPPTDNLDYLEVQRRIDALLPEIPGLLQFKPLCKFKFAEWPNGIKDSGAKYQEAFNGYSIKTDNNKVYILDKEGRSIFEFNPANSFISLRASDFPNKNILFDDFSFLRNDLLVIADNSRNALLFFKNNRFDRNIGFDGNRILFRHIDFIESDRLGRYIAVYDSGRDTTYVFSEEGQLIWEISGRTEPCFYGNSLIRFDKSDNTLSVQRVSDITRDPVSLATYSCQAGNIILDAWTAGTSGGQLIIVVYEGRGDEDHLDYAKLLIIKDQSIKTQRFRPNLDLRLSLNVPYRLLMTRKGLELITARIVDDGIEIIGAPVK